MDSLSVVRILRSIEGTDKVPRDLTPRPLTDQCWYCPQTNLTRRFRCSFFSVLPSDSRAFIMIHPLILSLMKRVIENFTQSVYPILAQIRVQDVGCECSVRWEANQVCPVSRGGHVGRDTVVAQFA